MWLSRFGNCTEGSLRLLEADPAALEGQRMQVSFPLMHPLSRRYSPLTAVELQGALLKRAQQGHQPPAGCCLAVKASLCPSAGIADSLEPNGDGGRGRAAILWGMGLKAVRVITANLCFSVCSPTARWVMGIHGGHRAVRGAMEAQLGR